MDFSHLGPGHAGPRRYDGVNLPSGSDFLPMLLIMVAHSSPISIHILRILDNEVLYETVEST